MEETIEETNEETNEETIENIWEIGHLNQLKNDNVRIDLLNPNSIMKPTKNDPWMNVMKPLMNQWQSLNLN